MSKLREAAQAVINRWYRLPGDNDRAILSDLFARLRAALAQPEAEPPRDEWRPASEPPEDLRGRVIAWRHHPQRQGGAWIEALYDDGAWVTRDGIAHDVTHWRDINPPTEGAE